MTNPKAHYPAPKPADLSPLFDAKVQRMVDDAIESFQATLGHVDGTRSQQVRTWATLLRLLAGKAGVESPEGVARVYSLKWVSLDESVAA